MSRHRQRNVMCFQCKQVIVVDANLDTQAVNVVVPMACRSPDECSDDHADGILHRPFEPDVNG